MKRRLYFYSHYILFLILFLTPKAYSNETVDGIEGSNLAKLFFPEKYETKLDDLDPTTWSDYDWSDCANSAYAYHLLLFEDSDKYQGRKVLVKMCSPDTLYTWQRGRGLQHIIDQIGPEKKNWPNIFERPIYTHTNPLATFAYGKESFRFKLKENVDVVLYVEGYGSQIIDNKDFCTNKILKSDQLDHAIIARYVEKNTHGQYAKNEFTFIDYIICSPQVIESWSWGEKMHYDELVIATIWYERANKIPNGYHYYEHYMKYKERDLLMGFDFDGNPMSWFILQQRMTEWQQKIDNSLLVTNPDASNFLSSFSSKSEKHFSTKRPFYFNEN